MKNVSTKPINPYFSYSPHTKVLSLLDHSFAKVLVFNGTSVAKVLRSEIQDRGDECIFLDFN